jgi:methyl-accepting chemotaxis protein
MNPLRARGISLRLALSFGLILVMVVAGSALSAVQLHALQQQADALVAQHIAILDALGRMQESAGERSVLLRDLVLNDNLKVQREVAARLAANSKLHAELEHRFAELAATGSGSARDAVGRIAELTRGTEAVEKTVASAVADARFDDAKAMLADQLTPRQQAMGRLLREAFVATMNEANRSVEENRSRERWTQWVLAGATLAALLLGVTTAFLTGRGIVRPVDDARRATLRMAHGDLAEPIVARSHDEVGQLVAGLETMRQALAGAVAGIRSSAWRVRTGAQAIERGSGDLAGRTEEQAASLEESASSMEEFTSTVQQNAQGAREASALASDAAAVAARGGEAVRGVVSTMQGIQAASARIADIIGVIDGIAFQTNILALNAAVEAARAGTHGRGFAVVAAEVRSLAQRCAEAAREIKTLIADATGRVDTGVQQVQAAGRTMDDIVASVRQVTALVTGISYSSAEQLAGIEQVNRAIAQMDGNTQRNAALVEETAEAARDMSLEAARLVEAVAQFRLLAQEGEEAARPVPVASAAERELNLLSLPAPLEAA